MLIGASGTKWVVVHTAPHSDHPHLDLSPNGQAYCTTSDKCKGHEFVPGIHQHASKLSRFIFTYHLYSPGAL
jgi:hypothetical protein